MNCQELKKDIEQLEELYNKAEKIIAQIDDGMRKSEVAHVRVELEGKVNNVLEKYLVDFQKQYPELRKASNFRVVQEIENSKRVYGMASISEKDFLIAEGDCAKILSEDGDGKYTTMWVDDGDYYGVETLPNGRCLLHGLHSLGFLSRNEEGEYVISQLEVNETFFDFHPMSDNKYLAEMIDGICLIEIDANEKIIMKKLDSEVSISMYPVALSGDGFVVADNNNLLHIFDEDDEGKLVEKATFDDFDLILGMGEFANGDCWIEGSLRSSAYQGTFILAKKKEGDYKIHESLEDFDGFEGFDKAYNKRPLSKDCFYGRFSGLNYVFSSGRQPKRIKELDSKEAHFLRFIPLSENMWLGTTLDDRGYILEKDNDGNYAFVDRIELPKGCSKIIRVSENRWVMCEKTDFKNLSVIECDLGLDTVDALKENVDKIVKSEEQSEEG